MPTDEEIRARRTYPFTKMSASLETVLGMQQHLNTAGFQSGLEDGIIGPITKAAITRFQQYCADNGDAGDPSIIGSGPVDGIFGPLTRNALDHYYYYYYRYQPLLPDVDPEDDPTI